MVVPGYEGVEWLAQFGEVEWLGEVSDDTSGAHVADDGG
jgi:hypothetical protein